MLCQEWFNRLWIVQETRLAAKAVMIIGDRELSWEKFTEAFMWIWCYPFRVSNLVRSFTLDQKACGGFHSLFSDGKCGSVRNTADSCLSIMFRPKRPDLCNPKHTTDQKESAIHHTGLLAIHRKSLRGFFLIIYDKTQSLGSF